MPVLFCQYYKSVSNTKYHFLQFIVNMFLKSIFSISDQLLISEQEVILCFFTKL